MGQHSPKFDWQGFRRIATPKRAAAALAELYGQNATMAAAQCALEAHGDGRDEDFRYWVVVFEMLCDTGRETGEAVFPVDLVNWRTCPGGSRPRRQYPWQVWAGRKRSLQKG